MEPFGQKNISVVKCSTLTSVMSWFSPRGPAKLKINDALISKLFPSVTIISGPGWQSFEQSTKLGAPIQLHNSKSIQQSIHVLGLT